MNTPAPTADRSLLIVEDDKLFLQRLAPPVETREVTVRTAEGGRGRTGGSARGGGGRAGLGGRGQARGGGKGAGGFFSPKKPPPGAPGVGFPGLGKPPPRGDRREARRGRLPLQTRRRGRGR